MIRKLKSLLSRQGFHPDAGQVAALADTPARWWRAITEMTSGYSVDTKKLLAVQFADVLCDDMVVLGGVTFASLCEHHLMPFTGVATIGYLPQGNRVVGLSKLARLVDAHARRLQVQERMTFSIADDLMAHLNPRGAGCVVRASHACMTCRGVMKPGAVMTTSTLRGVFRETAVRQEFLSFAV